MPGLRRPVQPRHVHQRGVADMIAAAHRDQAFCHKSAVEPDQGRHVGDGAERDVMQHAEQIRLRHLGGPESPRAQFPVDRDQRHQHQANRGEMAEAGEIVRAVRVHQRIDDRQLVAALMMVDHDHRHAEPLRLGQRLEAGGAAIDGDQQRRALFGEHAHGFDVGAVAFENAIGNVNQRIEPAMAQMPRQQRRRGRAVDIVVAEDRDLLLSRPPRPRCASPRPPSASRYRDPASACGWSDRENPPPRRSRRRARPAPAPAFPAVDSAARSQAPAPTPADRAGRATVFPSPIATRRERPAAIRQAMRMRGAS